MIKRLLTCVFLVHAIIGIAQETIFLTSATYTVPQNINEIFIEVVGAGGNGKPNGASGGGGGGYASGIYQVTPGQVLNVIVGQNSGSNRTSSVNTFLEATGGTDATFNTTPDGFGIAGVGGKGFGGNISNRNGGDGGQGYWTYFGGGGGGGGGRTGNGGPGGSTTKYDRDSCPHKGGAAGISGGFPGGNGGKGAGYLNCPSWDISPATEAGNYGAGGGGGNGDGSPATNGTNGWVRISTCLIKPEITQLGLTLHSHEENATYKWVDQHYNPIPNASNKTFSVQHAGSYAVILSNGSCTDTSAFVHISKADLIKESHLYGTLVFEQDTIYSYQNIPGVSPLIEVTGAGGNGAGNGAGGGGGGGYAAGIYTLTQNTDYVITVGKNSGNRSSSFSSLLSASGGTNGTFLSDANGYSGGGNGGIGSNGTLANHQGGNGGKGYWTYYGGGGGGAAGRKGNGSDGGFPKPYVSGDCSDEGGSGGLSGGYPGGHGSKGAGYNNCAHGSDNFNPATSAQKYGAGGGGGNGSGSPATNGADGVVIINFCSIDFEVIPTGNTLEAKTESGNLQWVKISQDSIITILSGETGKSFTAPATGNYALYISNGVCSGYSTIYHQEVITGKDISLSGDKIRFYPNPASDYIVVEAASKDLETVRILAINGTELLSQNRNNRINTSGLSDGLYILQIVTKTGTHNQQIHIR